MGESVAAGSELSAGPIDARSLAISFNFRCSQPGSCLLPEGAQTDPGRARAEATALMIHVQTVKPLAVSALRSAVAIGSEVVAWR